MDDRWEVASEKFLDFINEGLQYNDDEQMIEDSGLMLQKFSFLIVALKNNDGTEFQKLRDFALRIHESVLPETEQKAVVVKACEILEEVFPEFYAENKKEVLELLN